jgi:simple sugar transport system substrate-binding protein
VRVDRGQLLRRFAAGAVAAGALGDAAPAEAAANPFPSHPGWKFVFVAPETTNPLFVPTQYGIQDACDLLGCTYQWTGSPDGDVSDVVHAVDSAVAAKVGGIAVSVVSAKPLAAPVGRALAAGIPTIAFSLLDTAETRLAFVGQDPYAAGVEAGGRIAKLVGRGEIAVFAPDTPASLRRLEGAVAGLARSGMPVAVSRVRLDDQPLHQLARIDAYLVANKAVRGALATDITATEGLGVAIERRNLRLKAGGYGVLPATLKLIDEGRFAFTVDEDPYLLGFLPVVQLFLARYSGGLVGPANVDTGLRFVTKANVRPYLTSKTRYEGSSSKRKFPITS